ncbi:MAG: hypothetical protein P8Y47_02205, partial [Alphaproteobacteria bacterium]
VQTLIVGLIVAIAAVFVGMHIWRSWRPLPSRSCEPGEEETCCIGCDGCKQLRTMLAFEADETRPSSPEGKKE